MVPALNCHAGHLDVHVQQGERDAQGITQLLLNPCMLVTCSVMSLQYVQARQLLANSRVLLFGLCMGCVRSPGRCYLQHSCSMVGMGGSGAAP